MLGGTIRLFTIVCLVLAIAAPALSQNQTTGAITGRAQDASGALIPGVDVTISSPAMIGGARNAVTDETGTYRFTLLTPGTYRVSFGLGGFKTINIDGNEVVASKTLTVNGTMEVATVAEEVTVTSAAPTIDLEAATVGVNWDKNKLDNLPYSRSLAGLTTMIPGLFQTSFDVGGSNFATGSNVSVRSYGRSGNSVVSIDGLIWDQGYADYGAFEEVNISTASKGADQMNSGVTVNMILKSGSNTFHGSFNQDLEKGAFQGTNIDDYLRKLGYSAGSNKFTTLRETYGDIGGPVKKDKLWFYVSYRDSYGGQFYPGFIGLSDGKQQEFYSKLQSPTAKLTYQLTQNQKVDVSWQLGRKWQPYRGASQYVPVEGAQNQDSWSTFGPSFKWTYIIGPRMTATAGVNRGGYWWPDTPWTKGCSPSKVCTDPNEVRREDTNSATSARVGPILSIYRRPIRWTWNGDISYFSTLGGRNNELKFGYYGWWDKSYNSNFGYPNQQIYRYKSTAAEANFSETTPDKIRGLFLHPDSVVVYDYPNKVSNGGGYESFYINDKITWNRKLTINGGVRFDRFSSWLPVQGSTGEGPFSPLLIYPERRDFPVYVRVVPRVSFAYDVKGNGKLALKASFGRYTGSSSSPGSQPGLGANDVNPNASKNCTFNNWDGSIPFKIPAGAKPGSCSGGSWDAVSQKLIAPTSSRTLDSYLKSDYLDEYTVGLEVGFNREYSMRFNVVRKFNFPGTTTRDLAQPFEAYTDVRSYADPGPDGIAGNGDDPAGGRVTVWSVPSAYPTQGEVITRGVSTRSKEGSDQYTAYEVTFNKSMSNKWSALASYTIDLNHESTNDSQNPNELMYKWGTSLTDLPYWSQALKMNGQYQLPWGLMWAGTYTAQSGSWYGRTVQVKDARGTNVTVGVDPRVGRYQWVNLWDNRISKRFKLTERQSIEGTFDLFNTVNINTITAWSVASGSTYHKPTSTGIIAPRVFKLGVRYKF